MPAPTITYDTPSIGEYATHAFNAEASTIGLRPGEWPERLETTMGNRMPLLRTSKRVDNDGDLLWVTYWQANGCISLRIFND